MKILFPFVGDSVGGSHWSVINLFIELQTKKYIDPRIVLHIADGPLSKHLDSMDIPYDIIPLNNLAGQEPSIMHISFFMLYHVNLIIKYINNNNIDIVHGNDLRINLTWSLSTKLSLAKYVWHQRTHLSSSIKWHAIRYLSDFVVSISSCVHNSLPNNLAQDLIVCINNPFNTRKIHDKRKSRKAINKKYPFLKNVFLIGYVGRLVSWKRIENILYALQQVIQHTQNTCKIYLMIVGEGNIHYTNKINSLISTLKLDDYVVMTGFSRNPSLVLSALDLLIAPSHNEPFGRVVVESMIQKTLVLASKSGGHLETVEHNKTGILYKEPSVNLLSKYIYRIVLKDINTTSIVNSAYYKAIFRYSSSRHASQIISIYESLMCKHRAKG